MNLLALSYWATSILPFSNKFKGSAYWLGVSKLPIVVFLCSGILKQLFHLFPHKALYSTSFPTSSGSLAADSQV